MPSTCPPREASLLLVREYVSNEGLIRHMLAVEAAVRAYARRFGADEHLWGTAALLHDFDYERWPNPLEHPLQGSRILRERGYPEEMIYAILSHADSLQAEFPRRSLLDRTLYACDELCGFLMACALVRPERLAGMKPSSVRKKMKQGSFAAAVRREDLLRGAADLGVEFDEHVMFCAAALDAIAGELELYRRRVIDRQRRRRGPGAPGPPQMKRFRFRSWLRSSARKSGWAIETRASPRSPKALPCRLTAPNSVTIQWTWPRVVTTPAPGFSSGTMREILPPAAVEGRAMIGLPPRETAAPRIKSIWPPIPE